jgi:hypothetical protein
VGASTGFGSFAGRASVSQEQKHGEAEGERAAYQEVDADGIFVQERLIHAEGLYQETPDGVKAHVKQEDVAGFEPLREATGYPEQDQAHEHVPHGLIEEGRMERGRVGELHRPVLRRDVYGPRQARRPSEKLLVEVVTPPTYGLAKDEASGGRIGEGERAYAAVAAKEE